ncbi:TPA: MFS transporter [Candidatus Poribacteria bacterium]|nr:MFS transporter [Candidatus Poribacteria bacterium]
MKMLTVLESPEKSMAEYVRRHARINFLLCFIDAVGFPAGLSFISTLTILPLFVRQLTDSNMLVGLIPSIGSMGFFLPQIFVANYVERLPKKRNYVMVLASIERVAILLLAILTVWLSSYQSWLLGGFFFCWIVFNFAMGFNSPAYSAMISKVIPPSRRGRLYGIAGAIGGGFGILSAELSRRLLTGYGFPIGYTYCFLLGFLVLTVSLLPLAIVREPIEPFMARLDRRSQLRSAVSVLRKDKDYRWYVCSQILYAFNEMGAAFYTVYAINRLGASEADVAVFTAILMGTGIVTNPFWGYMADIFGNRKVLIFGTACALAAPVMAIALPALKFFYIVFVLNRLANTGVWLASYNIVMEFAPPRNVPTYSALRSTLMAPLRIVAPILGGFIADHIGYNVVFLISIVMTGIGLTTFFQFQEPRNRT